MSHTSLAVEAFFFNPDRFRYSSVQLVSGSPNLRQEKQVLVGYLPVLSISMYDFEKAIDMKLGVSLASPPPFAQV